MVDFRFNTFRGVRPRVKARLLTDNEAQLSLNTRLGSGDVRPWNDVTQVLEAFDSTIQSIHRMDNNGSPIWLQSTNDVDYAPGPVADDTIERTYYTGEAQPRMTYTTIAAGADPLPDDYRYLGIPAPSTAPTLVPDALPFEAPTGTVDISSIDTNYLLADVGDGNAAGITATAVGSWRMANADTSTPANGTQRALEFDVYVGLQFRVAATPDANTLTLENVSSDDFLVGPSQRSAATELLFKMDDPSGDDPTYYFRPYLPNSIDVTCTGHNLEVGDIIEVTQIPTSCVVQMTQSAAGPFWGTLTIDTAAPAAVRTWPDALSPIPTDSFFTQGRGLELEEIWIDSSGAGSGSSFTIVGEFDWTLVARGGVSYTDLLADVEARAYVFTYVSELGEEGPPSPASEVVTILSGASVEITQTGTPPSTQRQIDFWRIYRANTGSATTDFQFVAEVAIGTTTYDDSLEDIDLGEPLQTTTWDPPPTGLKGITAGPNGMMIGFVGKTLHLAEPYFPHAYPPEYKRAVEFDIVGIGVLPNGFAILTTGTPYALVGDHPRGMSLQKFDFNQACTSKRSITSTLDSVMYASPDGLCEIGGGAGFRVITRDHMTKDEWQAFTTPSEIVGAWHDGKYFGFTSSSGFIFDPNDESIGLSTIPDNAVDAFVDPEDDTLYLLTTPPPSVTGRIVAVATGGTGQRAAYSDDGGATWTAANSIPTKAWESVAYSPTLKLWVAVADFDAGTNYLAYSPDGDNWTQGALGTSDFYGKSVIWVPELELFVCGGLDQGGSNTVCTSDDGINWTLRTSSMFGTAAETLFWLDDEALIFSVGSTISNGARTSPDGINWSGFIDISASNRFGAYAAGDILLPDSDDDLRVRATATGSPTTYAAAFSVGATGERRIAYSATLDIAVAVAEAGAPASSRVDYASSSDWSSWSLVTGQASKAWNAVLWAPENARFIIASNSTEGVAAIQYSDNGTSFTSATMVPDLDYSDMAEGDANLPLSIASWNTGSPRTFTWKSGKLKTPYPINLGAGRIVANSYPVTLNIWDQEGNNVVVDRPVTDDKVFRLPGGYLSGVFEIQIENDDGVEMVHVAETVEELLEG